MMQVHAICIATERDTGQGVILCNNGDRDMAGSNPGQYTAAQQPREM